MFFERRDQGWRCTYHSGARAEYFRDWQLSFEQVASPVIRAALCGHRIVARGLERAVIPGDRAFLAIPFADAGAVPAVLYVASTSVDAFGAEESIVTAVELAVAAYGLAVERELDRNRATIDALTGLLTPRALRARLTEACARSTAQPNGHIALLFVDTDNFKACNDAFGHAAGDQVLRNVAKMLAREAGPEAHVGRNGGDEFCVVLPGVVKIDAILQAERMRASIESFAFSQVLGGASLSLPITTSIGVAVYPIDAPNPSALLEAADAAMYHSKHLGRNRVSFYDSSGIISELALP